MCIVAWKKPSVANGRIDEERGSVRPSCFLKTEVFSLHCVVGCRVVTSRHPNFKLNVPALGVLV